MQWVQHDNVIILLIFILARKRRKLRGNRRDELLHNLGRYRHFYKNVLSDSLVNCSTRTGSVAGQNDETATYWTAW